MKVLCNVFFTALLSFSTLFALGAQKEIKFNGLPLQAQKFIKTYFDCRDIVRVSMDTEYLLWKEYIVSFKDGTKIEFDSDGSWEEVKRKLKPVPAVIIPANITAYITRSFPDTFIQKIERNSTKYEVEISNGLDLEFDTNGQFLRIDD